MESRAGVADFASQVRAEVEVAKQQANGNLGALPRTIIACLDTPRLLQSLPGQWVALVQALDASLLSVEDVMSSCTSSNSIALTKQNCTSNVAAYLLHAFHKA